MSVKHLRQHLLDWIEADSLGDFLPEVAALDGVNQSPDYHAEGDALTHTLLALKSLPEQVDERVFWAVLLHDIGKAETTAFVDGRWRSYGHDRVGAKMVPGVLARFGRNELAEDVIWLVARHHFAMAWGDSVARGLSWRQRRFCSHRLFPLLLQVAYADAAGSRGISDKGLLARRIEKLARKAGLLGADEV